MKENNGYSLMHINVVGTNIERDHRRDLASHWIFASSGFYIALMIMNLQNIRYPAILGTPLVVVTVAGVLITQVWDLFRGLKFDINSGDTHIPLIVNSMTMNVRCDLLRKEGKAPLQVFEETYKCKEIIKDGRIAYRLSGRPSGEMIRFIKTMAPKLNVLVFFVRRISLIYTVNTEGADMIGDVFAKCSKEKNTKILVI